MHELAFQSALQLAKLIANKTISSLELTNYFIDRIERYNPAINAVVAERFDRAQNEARLADKKLAQNKAIGCFHGLPITVKESFNICGLPTTFGLPLYKENIPKKNALAINRLIKAGVVILGKTNVPLNLADYQSYNPIYGCTNNPWDTALNPGGSSGGSAAALSAGLSALEIGSDIGGSVRSPAHFCGLFSHKPTYSLIPMEGQSLPGNFIDFDMSVIGPMARSAPDLKASLLAMHGPYAFQSNGLDFKLPIPTKKINDYKVAIWPNDTAAPVSRSTLTAIDKVVTKLQELGVNTDTKARPDFSADEHKNAFDQLLWTIMGSRLNNDEYQSIVEEVERFSVSEQSAYTNMQRAKIATFRQYQQVNNERWRLRRLWHEFFQRFDFLITPVMSVPAFPHQHIPFASRYIDVDGDKRPYLEQIFWCSLANFCYLPATVIPTGTDEKGLPIGIQIIGPEFSDLLTINLAEQLEKRGFSFIPPPHFSDDN